MSNISFSLDTTKSLPDKPLKDVEQELISATANFKVPISPIGDVVTIKLSADANGKVEAFNSRDDTDDDNVIGAPTKEKDSTDAIVLEPQLPYSDETAWLKYRFEASASASASAAVAPIGFKIDAKKKAVFADYRAHQPAQNTLVAGTEDVKDLRFFGDPKDAFLLSLGDALFYEVRGEFSSSVTLSWSDVFTAALGPIAANLQANQLLTFEIDAAVSVEFHVGIVDDFRIVITRIDDEKVRIALKKSKSNEFGVSAGFQVAAKFADEEKVSEIFEKIYEKVLGQPLAKIKGLLDKPANELEKLLSELPEPERDLVDFLIARLKLDAPLKTLNDLKDRIETFEGKIKGALESAAKAKVEFGFKYEYLRVKTEDSLLSVKVNEEIYRQFHTDLMLCDFRGLLSWASQNLDSVERYLNQTVLKRSSSWGFSLNFMKWNVLSSKDTKSLTSTVQTDIQGREKIAYQGVRGYEASFLGKFDWSVDFMAEMNSFSQSPTACDFDYGLFLRRSWKQKMNEDGLREFLDDALIWKVLTLSNLQEAIETIKGSGGMDKTAEVSVEIKIKDKELRAILSKVSAPVASNPSDTKPSLMSVSLAMAMPYNKDFPTRADRLNDRQQAYAKLWEFYMKNPFLDIGSYAQSAGKYISQLSDLADEQNLAFRERQNIFFDTFSQQIEKNGLLSGSDYSGIKVKYDHFIDGLKLLNQAVTPGQCAPSKTVEKVFSSLSPFWSQSLFVRAVGVYLTTVAEEVKELANLEKVCRIAFADGKVFTFGKSL